MTKTMQPVLPKSSTLEPMSEDWWYTLRQETNSALDKMLFLRPKTILVAFEPSKRIMNTRGLWDCQHITTHMEEFFTTPKFQTQPMTLDEVEIEMIEVCSSCDKYFDDRIDEWIASE